MLWSVQGTPRLQISFVEPRTRTHFGTSQYSAMCAVSPTTKGQHATAKMHALMISSCGRSLT